MCESNVILANTAGLGQVRLCSCGCVHLNLGPVTIRLEPAALAQAAAMLQTAAEKQKRMRSQNNSDAKAFEQMAPGTLVN